MYENKPIWIDPEWIREKYLVEKLSISQIAELAECDWATIRRRFDWFNVSMRNKKSTVWSKHNLLYKVSNE